MFMELMCIFRKSTLVMCPPIGKWTSVMRALSLTSNNAKQFNLQSYIQLQVLILSCGMHLVVASHTQ